MPHVSHRPQRWDTFRHRARQALSLLRTLVDLLLLVRQLFH